MVVLILLGIIFGMVLTQKEVVVEQQVVNKEVTKVVIEGKTFKLSAREGYVIGRYGNALDIRGDYAKQAKQSVVLLSINIEENFGNVQITFPNARIHTEDQAFLEGELKFMVNRLTTFEEWQTSPVMLDETFFGNTKRGFDLLPTTRAYLAAFGKGDILLDDQEVYGNLNAIVMYTEGIRDENLAIKKDGKAYTTKLKEDNFADKSDRELHIFFFSDIEDKKNFPTRHVWVSLFFEDPKVISAPRGMKK